MASTLIIYQGTGSQTDYTVPFDYLKKSFVNVSLEGEELTGGDPDDTGADYYFIDNTTIRLKVAPPAGQFLTVRRYTSETERVATFKDASVLKANDLDTSQLQAFHIAAEARDIINDALIQNKDGNWDAKGKRIINVGAPVDNSDAVTYGVYKTDALGALHSKIAAEKARDRAILAETNAKLSEVNSKRSEDNAKLSEVNAQASAGTAVSASKHADAVKVENQAILNEAREIQTTVQKLDKSTKENATIATTKAEEAKGSAEKAKESEVNAKESEKVVTGIAGTIVPIAPEIKIVADNIDHVVTDYKSIDKINIVGTDLAGTLHDTIYDDYGDLGNPEAPMPVINGGNIKIVADNIEAVRTVAGLAPDFNKVINSVDTVTKLTVRAETAATKSEASATQAGESEANAMASEAMATDKATEAKDWANKMDGTVDGSEYSAKYYANRAKTEGGQAVETAKAQALQQINTANTTAIKEIGDKGTQQKALLDTQVAEATRQAKLAEASATLASNEADAAQTAERASTASAVASEASAKNSANSASMASAQAIIATNKATEAKNSADNAALSKDAAKTSENNAKKYADSAASVVSDKLDKAVFDGFVDYGDLGNQ